MLLFELILDYVIEPMCLKLDAVQTSDFLLLRSSPYEDIGRGISSFVEFVALGAILIVVGIVVLVVFLSISLHDRGPKLPVTLCKKCGTKVKGTPNNCTKCSAKMVYPKSLTDNITYTCTNIQCQRKFIGRLAHCPVCKTEFNWGS